MKSNFERQEEYLRWLGFSSPPSRSQNGGEPPLGRDFDAFRRAFINLGMTAQQAANNLASNINKYNPIYGGYPQNIEDLEDFDSVKEKLKEHIKKIDKLIMGYSLENLNEVQYHFEMPPSALIVKEGHLTYEEIPNYLKEVYKEKGFREKDIEVSVNKQTGGAGIYPMVTNKYKITIRLED